MVQPNTQPQRLIQLHHDSRGTYGIRRLQSDLQDEQRFHGKSRISRLMKQCGLKAANQTRHKVTTNSQHDYPIELAKALAYTLNQWSAVKYYAEDGWAEAENNIAENALRMVSLGRKNWLFFGSEHGGERGAQPYSLIGTRKLNGVDPESYFRYVLDVIADWPVNRVSELLPWRVVLPAE